MSILIETRCSMFTKMLSEIALYEQNIPVDTPEEHIRQYKFHIASCGNCFYRAEPFIEEKREYCPQLFKVPKYAYFAGKILKEEQVPEYSKIFIKKLELKELDKIEVHIKNCKACSFWLGVIENGWNYQKNKPKQIIEQQSKLDTITIGINHDTHYSVSWPKSLLDIEYSPTLLTCCFFCLFIFFVYFFSIFFKMFSMIILCASILSLASICIIIILLKLKQHKQIAMQEKLKFSILAEIDPPKSTQKLLTSLNWNGQPNKDELQNSLCHLLVEGLIKNEDGKWSKCDG